MVVEKLKLKSTKVIDEIRIEMKRGEHACSRKPTETMIPRIPIISLSVETGMQKQRRITRSRSYKSRTDKVRFKTINDIFTQNFRVRV